MKSLILIFFILLYLLSCGSPKSNPNKTAAEQPQLLDSKFLNSHPSAYYIYAQGLWNEEKKEDALFWFYVGQLRWRFYISSLSKPKVDAELATYGTLQDSIGSPINLYAGADVEKWVQTIEKVISWDEKNDNGFTSKKKFEKEWKETQIGFLKLKDELKSKKEQIKAQRDQNGVGNIGVVNGVYIEEQKKKMPSAWPALEKDTSLKSITGIYNASMEGFFAPTFFFNDQYKVLNTTTYEISSPGPNLLLIIAKNDKKELLRRTIPIVKINDAITFEEHRKAEETGLLEGGSLESIFLRKNKSGELVIQRNSLIEGKTNKNKLPVKLTYTNWNRESLVLTQQPLLK